MTIILLVRHGHVEGIKPERFRGRADLVLTETGQRQAELLARRIASRWAPSSIFTSPLQRCIATGAAVAKACGVPSEPLAGLYDLDYGAWQSLTYHDARASDPGLFAAWFTTPHLVGFPDGESLQDVAARTANVLRFVLSRNEADTLVLVGHDSVNRVLLTQILDMPLSAYWRLVQNPCSINEIEVTGSSFQLRRMNDTEHLDLGTTCQSLVHSK
jgi:phosphoserine phosphatase